jgi:hypothetical protein
MSVHLAAAENFLAQDFGPPVNASNTPAAPEDDGEDRSGPRQTSDEERIT